MAKQGERRRAKAVTDDEDAGRIGGGPGASDGSSGGGAGSGIPGGGTDMRTNGRFSGGDVQKDKEKLFPELAGKKKRSSAKPMQGKCRK
jgi:hypothetical protein